MPLFTFDPSLHLYRLDGVEIPSVTQILREAGLVSHLNGFQEAVYRGLYAHEACEYLDLNDLDWRTVHPAYAGYVRAYERFKSDTGFVPELIEYQAFHPVYRYAGTLDRRGLIDGKPVLLDLKTGAEQPWWPLQLAGYQLLGGENWKDDQRLNVKMNEDGTYRLYRYFESSDIPTFLSALTMAQWKRRHP